MGEMKMFLERGRNESENYEQKIYNEIIEKIIQNGRSRGGPFAPSS